MLFKSERKGRVRPDSWLIDKFIETGELDYLGDLYVRYMHLVYGVCIKYLKDRSVSQDAVMQIFEKLIVELPGRKIENFKPWLYVITKNHCLMQLRSQKSKQTHEKKIGEYHEIFMENSYELHHNNESGLDYDIKTLEKCIEELKTQQKKCIKLFYLEEKCYQEIVDITKFELKKVKSYIQNGKRNLKICMDKHGR
ncbi:MAG: sigma-70 family RNA polymerase sigma factor [Cytophagales bacterium]|nr:sigma-70 family RNA polymerase sigma factor [Cytophagales bacterium]